MNNEIRSRLYKKYYPMILNRCNKYMDRNIDDGISMCSEIFLNCLQNHRYNGFGTYLYKQISNELLNHIRKEKKKILFSELDEDAIEETVKEKQQETFDITVYSLSAQKVIRIILNQEIKRLGDLTKILMKEGWELRKIRIIYKEIKGVIQRNRRTNGIHKKQ